MHSFVSTTGGSRPRYGGSSQSRRSRSASLATNLYSNINSRRSSGYSGGNNRRWSGLAEFQPGGSVHRLFGGGGRKRPSDSEMAAAVAASTNVATTHHDEKSDRAHLIEHEDPILARTITVEDTFRRMEVNICTSFLSFRLSYCTPLLIG